MFYQDFVLIQHTPLLHFENLKNATIRLTELKSKLDKFLIRECKDKGIEIEQSNRRKFLRYKVFLEIPDAHNISIRKIEKKNKGYPLYFGNMGDDYDNNPRYQSNVNGKLKIRFFCFDKTILNCIKENFEAFLANTNFGTRQSKGYGSFYLYDKPFNPALIKKPVYKFSIEKTNWVDAFSDIELFYRFLRQGINIPIKGKPLYCKPAVFSYLKEKYSNLEWEKRLIKQTCFSNQLKGQIKNHQNSDILQAGNKTADIRDIFGLSTEESWRSYNKAKIKKSGINGIERFKSPLLIKPIKVDGKFDVYIFEEDRNEERLKDFLGSELIITIVNKDKKDCKSMHIKVIEEFCFDKFFEYVSKINMDEYAGRNYHETYEYKKLKSILKSFRKAN